MDLDQPSIPRVLGRGNLPPFPVVGECQGWEEFSGACGVFRGREVDLGQPFNPQSCREGNP